MLIRHVSIIRFLSLGIIGLFLIGCDNASLSSLNPFRSKPTVDPCDPATNLYDDGKHFLERDYLTEEGTIDYKKLLEMNEIQKSPCDPLQKKKP